jgi:16S rRNA C1402 (ribose-2'-O) methylase RsmI
MPHPLRTLTFRCCDHHNIKGTHGKTLEWTRESEITPRATCIVGVSADFDPVEAARLRGPLRITMQIEETEWVEVVHAFATPLAAARESLVVRCSEEQGGRTFAIRADKGAAALDRDFVRTLADPLTALGRPWCTLVVTVEELPAPQPELCGALLLACPPMDWEEGTLTGEAAARLAAVDGVVDLRRVHSKPQEEEAFLHRLLQGERLVLVGDPLDPIVRRVAGSALATGVTVSPLWGVSPWQAVAATAAGSHGLHLEMDALRKPVALRKALAETRYSAVVTLLPVVLPPAVVLEALLETVPEQEVILGRELLTRKERLLRGTPEELGESWSEASRDPRHPESLIVAVPPRSVGDGLGRLAPVFEELLARGVSVRTLADAAAQWPGLSRKQAYGAILRLAESEEEP